VRVQHRADQQSTRAATPEEQKLVAADGLGSKASVEELVRAALRS